MEVQSVEFDSACYWNASLGCITRVLKLEAGWDLLQSRVTSNRVLGIDLIQLSYNHTGWKRGW